MLKTTHEKEKRLEEKLDDNMAQAPQMNVI